MLFATRKPAWHSFGCCASFATKCPLLNAKCLPSAEAAELYPELFTSWRQDPMHFEVGGVFPVRDLWNHAQNAWEDILTQATVSVASSSTCAVSSVSGWGVSSVSVSVSLVIDLGEFSVSDLGVYRPSLTWVYRPSLIWLYPTSLKSPYCLSLTYHRALIEMYRLPRIVTLEIEPNGRAQDRALGLLVFFSRFDRHNLADHRQSAGNVSKKDSRPGGCLCCFSLRDGLSDHKHRIRRKINKR